MMKTSRTGKELNRELKAKVETVPGAYEAMVKMVYVTAKEFGLQQKIIDYIDEKKPDDVGLLKYLGDINPKLPK